MQDVLNRRLRRAVAARLAVSPAVALLGPRQVGKTTLAKSFGGLYFDLEQERERLRADLAWDELVAGSSLVILDEAQSWPEAFVRVRGAIDRDRKRMGRFLLLGSVSPVLMRQVSESLTGRLSLIELTPLLTTELRTGAPWEFFLTAGKNVIPSRQSSSESPAFRTKGRGAHGTHAGSC